MCLREHTLSSENITLLLAHVARRDKPFTTPSYIRAAEAHSGVRLITRKNGT